jgi:hypothetical protein
MCPVSLGLWRLTGPPCDCSGRGIASERAEVVRAFYSLRGGLLERAVQRKWWRTSEASDTGDWLPAEWSSPQNGSTISVVLELNSNGDKLTLTRLGRAVAYAPTEITEADLCA